MKPVTVAEEPEEEKESPLHVEEVHDKFMINKGFADKGGAEKENLSSMAVNYSLAEAKDSLVAAIPSNPATTKAPLEDDKNSKNGT